VALSCRGVRCSDYRSAPSPARSGVR